MTESQICSKLDLGENYIQLLRKHRAIYNKIMTFDNNLYLALCKYSKYISNIQELIINLESYPIFELLLKEVYKSPNLQNPRLAFYTFSRCENPLKCNKKTTIRVFKFIELYEEYMAEQIDIYERFKNERN